MKNIFLLPTDKPSRLFKTGNFLLLDSMAMPNNTLETINQNIYITSEEEIKEGDWVITNGGLRFVTKLNNDKIKSFIDDGTISKQSPSPYCRLEYYKKIILTTDQDLIKDGIQAIDDDFLEWFVKNPSCENVKIHNEKHHIGEEVDESYPKGFFDFKIIIPQEVKTSEEWQKQLPYTKVLDPDGWYRNNFQYSWFEEKITLAEYTTRLCRSTVKRIIPQGEPKLTNNCPKCGLDLIEREGSKPYCTDIDCRGIILSNETLKEFAARKQESVEIAARKLLYEKYPYHYPKYGGYFMDMFMEGAKWQEERTYSEEDMRYMYDKSCGLIGLELLDDQTENDNRFKEILEQFKKKK